MNISIRTLLISLLLGLPLILGSYTYLYSIKTSESRIISETEDDVLRTLTHRADTIRYFLNIQNKSQVLHEVAKLGENINIRQALLFNDSRVVSASIHVANRTGRLDQVLELELGPDAQAVLEKLNYYMSGSSNQVYTWLDTTGNSIYGIAPIHYTKRAGSIRPDSSNFLFIQQDLSTDLAASNSLAINIIIVQFVLSMLVIVLVNQFVLSRLNMLKKIATSFLGNDAQDSSGSTRDEIDLLDRTVSQMAEDLTDASNKLKQQSQFTLNVINSTDEGIFGIDTEGHITFANHACLRLLGYISESQLLGQDMHSLFLHSHRNGTPFVQAESPIQQSLLFSNKLHSEQEVFWCSDNNYIEVEYWTSPLRVNQQHTGLVVTFMDISKRKKAQQDLIIKDAAITNSLHGIAMGDMKGKIFYVNDAMVRMWAYDSDKEIIGQSVLKFWKHPEQADLIMERLINQEKVTTEMEGLRKDGSSFIAHLSANISTDQYGQPLCLMSSFIDISDQKEVEAALLRSEETYAKAEEIAHIGSWDWDILNGDLRWTDEIYRIFGLQPQAFGATYDAFVKTIHPEDRDNVGAAVGATVADVNTPYSIEHRIVRPDGEIRVVHERGKVYRNKDGEPVRMIGTVHDITETKEFEKALREERNFVNAILDSAGALVVVLDSHGQVIRFNRACQETTGFSHEEIVDDYVWSHLLKTDMVEAAQEMFTAPENIPAEFTNPWLTKQGDERLISWSNRPLRNESSEIEFIVSLGIDITEKDATEKELEKHRQHLELLIEERTQELEQAQDELVRKERLATLGQLTATVSHELRNPLGAMRPSMYLIKRLASGDNEKLNNAIERVERNIARCDHIIDELLDFTRITDIDAQATPLESWLQSILEEQSIPDTVQVIGHYGLTNLKLNIDQERLRRCVINVVENACQAMTDEDFKPNSERLLTISTKHEDARVYIHIDDTGPGIEEKTLNRIFEPLFSTKGFGVGLGLPTVKQIMQQHQGDIEVTSTPGNGTRMSLWLPDNRISD